MFALGAEAMRLEELPHHLDDHLRATRVPDVIRRAIVAGDLKRTAALIAAEDWVKGPQRMLALVGRNGSGKSLAAAWCISVNLVAYDVYLNTPGDLPKDYRFRSALFAEAQSLAWPKDQMEDAVPFLRRAKQCALLVIDEAGREDGDGARGLGSVLAYRAETEGKRTIITSNLLEKDFAERYKGRIMSRLRGSGRIVVADGHDLRLKGA